MQRRFTCSMWLQFVAIGVGLFLLAEPVSATIIGGNVTGGTASTGGGIFIKLIPPLSNPKGAPNSVGEDTFDTLNLYGFDEDQNIQLTAPLYYDGGMGGTLPAGTIVASHYIFFDPLDMNSIIGTIDFDADVLAIITWTNYLSDSDFLANTGVNYLSPNARGLETFDYVNITGSRQIQLELMASTPGDYVRILTAFSPNAAVPEPATMLLFGSGLIGIAGYGRKKFFKK